MELGHTGGSDGRLSAWETIFSAEYIHLVRTAAFLLGNASDGEDAVHDLWLSVKRRTSRTGGELDVDDISAYLRRGLLNTCRSMHRRHVAVANIFTQGDRTQLSMHDYDPVFERDSIVRALTALPRRLREAVVLRYYADLTVAETARIMKVSPGAVKGYCAEGLQRLNRFLTKEQASGP